MTHLTRASLLALAIELNSSMPHPVAFDDGVHYAVALRQWTKDVNRVADVLESVIPSFDRYGFTAVCGVSE